ncbi:MAG: glycoside hydrolase family 13 protein [Lachnospiraceae bacterium]|nr:glycoside hydrolase family 13 protein [Lachnospiraceae bacterium]
MSLYENLSPHERARRFMAGNRPIFNKNALFSDMTEDYVSPPEPRPFSIVTLRFRTLRRNVDYVYLVKDKERILMECTDHNEEFDFYSARLALDNEPVNYCFEVIAGRIRMYYDRRGPVRANDLKYCFRLIPGFSTPEWSKGAVMYQIFTERYCDGDPTNNPETGEYFYINGLSRRVTDWNKTPEAFGVREFYGGDLAGVMSKLPLLKNMGIEVIYFNPLFVSPSNHKYDIQDYDYIDPHFGVIIHDGGSVLSEGESDNAKAARYIRRVTDRENLEQSNALFAELVRRAHEMGIKVIIDGVFNHCGSFNKWMDRERIYEYAEGFEKGAYVDASSPYHEFFNFQGGSWPYNNTYEGWWGHDTLPKLNYEDSPRLYDYILSIARKWVSSPYNADGWRLDVAADLGRSIGFNHKFWKDFRRAVKEANPEAVILAEHYGNPRDWLSGDEWDSIMNYDAFMEPVTWFLTGMEKHSDDFRPDLLNNASAFWGAMLENQSFMNYSSMNSCMNELSNHDHSRFLTRTNHKVGRVSTLGPEAASEGINKAVMREAVLLQMTWVGCPTIYYGDEAGLVGFTDPDNRRTYPWGNEDYELMDFHRACIRIHKENRELKTGSLLELFSGEGFIAYGRFNKDGASVVVINNNDHPVDASIPVWRCGVKPNTEMKRLIFSYKESFTTLPELSPVRDARMKVSMPPFSAALFKKDFSLSDHSDTRALLGEMMK